MGRKERDIKVKITLELICRVILTDVWRIGYCRIIKSYTINAERIKLGMVVTPDLEVTTELVSTKLVNKHLHAAAFFFGRSGYCTLVDQHCFTPNTDPGLHHKSETKLFYLIIWVMLP